MLKPTFDFNTAHFRTLDELSAKEVVQADLVQFDNYVPGGIYHSKQTIWYGNLEGYKSVESFIRSKKVRKTVKTTLQYFQAQGYEFSIVPVDESVYEEFVELYKETTLKRERALMFNLREQILSKVRGEIPVYMVGMYLKGKLESGLVFSLNKSKNEVAVSFGAKKKFPQVRGGVGGSLEYYLIEYCLQHHIQTISHGRSLNPAGITGKAGIFEFKARYGFTAYPENRWQSTFLISRKPSISDLVFVTLADNQLSYHIITDASEHEVKKKYKARGIHHYQVTPFDDLIAQHRAALDQLITSQSEVTSEK